MENYSVYAKVFKALGDPKRAMIIDMLSCGELCACRILEKFEMSQSTLAPYEVPARMRFSQGEGAGEMDILLA